MALLLAGGGCASVAPTPGVTPQVTVEMASPAADDLVGWRREIFFHFHQYTAISDQLGGIKAQAYASVLVDLAADFGLSESDTAAMQGLPLKDQWQWIMARTRY